MVDGELWFKSDDEANAFWDAEGCTERFTFTFKDGTVDGMNYRRAPSDVYDDAEAMQRWAALAVEAGRARAGEEAQAEEGLARRRPQMRRDLGARPRSTAGSAARSAARLACS